MRRMGEQGLRNKKGREGENRRRICACVVDSWDEISIVGRNENIFCLPTSLSRHTTAEQIKRRNEGRNMVCCLAYLVMQHDCKKGATGYNQRIYYHRRGTIHVHTVL